MTGSTSKSLVIWGFVIAALVMLIAKHSSAFVAVFAPTGRMAFTNYLTQSVVGTFVFYGWGLGHFGQVGYARQLLVVAGIWAFQVVFSIVWLQAFRYGPLEWLWRSATYGKLPPLRRNAVAVASAA